MDNKSPAPETVLPEYLRRLIPYPSFTKMQQHCLDTWHTNDNILISAPTGAGKTMCFELAIFRLIHASLSINETTKLGASGLRGKIVFLAPSKALCDERARDWKQKFAQLSLRVQVVTGDANLSTMDPRVKNADLIIATAEKWDSVTRHVGSRNASDITSTISLLLLDEVHQVGDSRGATFESVVTRMLLACDRATAKSTTRVPVSSLRIIAVSATVQNPSDVARWLRVPPQGVRVFDESYRPVPMEYKVLGYRVPNQWQTHMVLDEHLPDVLRTYSEGRPALVFCTSRRQTISSAKSLLNFANRDARNPMLGNRLTVVLPVEQRHRLFNIAAELEDPYLRILLPHGICIHNADMSTDSRALVEQLFRESLIRCLFSTSTLAQGVNLPARLVVICGTSIYRDGNLHEYSRNLLIQMCGRAGRPGLDCKGVSVVMTTKPNVQAYEKLHGTCDVLESQLKNRMMECLIAEIARQDIFDAPSAAMFLSNSFFSARLLSTSSSSSTASEQNTAVNSTIALSTALQNLRQANLILFDDDGHGLCCTFLGTTMAKYCLSSATIAHLNFKLPEASSLSQVLEVIASCPEVLQDLLVRRSEKKTLKELNSMNRFPVRGLIQEPVDKALVLLQAVIGNDRNWGEDHGLKNEAVRILRTASRVCSFILELVLQKGIMVRPKVIQAVFQICRALINGHMWDGPGVLQQVSGISPNFAKAFVRGGIYNIANLGELEVTDISNKLGCDKSTALRIQESLKFFPKFSVFVETKRDNGEFGRVVSLKIHVEVYSVLAQQKYHSNGNSKGFVMVGSDVRGLVVVETFKLEMGRFVVECEVPSDVSSNQVKWVEVLVGCDNLLGLDIRQRFQDEAKKLGGGRNLARLPVTSRRISKRVMLQPRDEAYGFGSYLLKNRGPKQQVFARRKDDDE